MASEVPAATVEAVAAAITFVVKLAALFLLPIATMTPLVVFEPAICGILFWSICISILVDTVPENICIPPLHKPPILF